MTIQSTDLFLVSNGGSKKCEAQNLSGSTGNVLVNRSGNSFQTPVDTIPDKVLDDDLMLVNRGGVSYKVSGAEVKGLFGTFGTVIVTGNQSLSASAPGSYTCTVTESIVDDLKYIWTASGGASIQTPALSETRITWATPNTTQSATCTVSSDRAGKSDSDSIDVTIGLPGWSGYVKNNVTNNQLDGGRLAPAEIHLSPPESFNTAINPGGGAFRWEGKSTTGGPPGVVNGLYQGGKVVNMSFATPAHRGHTYRITCSVTTNSYSPSTQTFIDYELITVY